VTFSPIATAAGVLRWKRDLDWNGYSHRSGAGGDLWDVDCGDGLPVLLEQAPRALPLSARPAASARPSTVAVLPLALGRGVVRAYSPRSLEGAIAMLWSPSVPHAHGW